MAEHDLVDEFLLSYRDKAPALLQCTSQLTVYSALLSFRQNDLPGQQKTTQRELHAT
jgi:hypothetical protein